MEHDEVKKIFKEYSEVPGAVAPAPLSWLYADELDGLYGTFDLSETYGVKASSWGVDEVSAAARELANIVNATYGAEQIDKWLRCDER